MADPIQQQIITARKNQILDAAATVFSAKGFHPTTIKDIAKQAGIAEGTIYNYFDSKPALLFAIFDRMKAAVVQENLPPAPEDLDFRTFIILFLRQPLMALQAENFALFRIVISEIMVNEDLRTQYHAQILEPTLALAEGYLEKQFARQGRNPASARLTVRLISSMMMGLMLEHIMGDATLAAHWEQLPEIIADLIINGLGADLSG